MRIAIVHDWLVTYAGAEKTLEQVLQCFPEADLFSLVDFLPDEQRQFLGGRKVRTSFLQSAPFARKHYRSYLPLMPLAVEQFDLSGYDLVISSSFAVAKGVLTGPDQVHVSLCYSPMRYAWDLQHQYLRESGMASGLRSWLARAVLHYMRLWDVRTAHGVDRFIAISAFVGRRIKKSYGRDSVVVFPPVDVQRFTFSKDKQPFYLAASRMVPYKRMPLIAAAFQQMPDKQLVIIGDGPDFERVRAFASPNIKVLGYQSQPVLMDHMQRAQAFIFAAEEDFGIAPLEAQACGTPVIAYGRGGATETIRGFGDPSPTGVFFSQQSPQAIVVAVRKFEQHAHEFLPSACRQNAMRFSNERFRSEFTAVIDSCFMESAGVVKA